MPAQPEDLPAREEAAAAASDPCGQGDPLLRRRRPAALHPHQAADEVNDILRTVHDDISSLRRELVDYRWLTRAGGIYRVADEVPSRTPDELQEVPADEARRLALVPRAGGAPTPPAAGAL